MNARRSCLAGVLLTALLVTLPVAAARGSDEPFTLARAVPCDVFLCIAGQHNPERDFLDAYWSEVFDALRACGVDKDALSLLGELLGTDAQGEEITRLKERASELLAGVDWDALVGKEVVFAERLPSAVQSPGGNISIGPPDMVWLFRGSTAGASENFDGLVAILQGAVEEINNAIGETRMTVERGSRHGGKLASVNMLASVPEAPPLLIGVALHDDVIAIALGQEMMTDVLGLLDGKASKEALADVPRYKAAFARLPAPEDSAVFFDMQAMLKSLRSLVDVAALHAANDLIINSAESGKAYDLSMQAWKVYEERNYQRGLELVEQAYALAPQDSRVLYYLACFHALLGHEDKALDFLARSVDGGFYCPHHISGDPDLASIRQHDRYEAALASARKNAAGLGEKDAGRPKDAWMSVFDRLMNAAGVLDYIAAVEFTEGHSVRTESIAALVPGASECPIYPVFGKRRQLTDFARYLPQETQSFAVSGGFDPSEFYTFIEDTFRVAGPSGEQALSKWAEIQEQLGFNLWKDVIGWLDGDFVSVTLADDQGAVWLIKVTDEQLAREKLTAAIEFLSTKLIELTAKNPALAMMSVRTSPLQHEQLEGFENLHLATAPQPIIWGVADKHLILGSSAEAITLCLETARGEHPDIRENARVMSEALVPTGPFTSVGLTDQRGLGEELAAGIGIASMVGGMAGSFVPDPDARTLFTRLAGMLAKLTPVVRKIDFFKSTAAHTTFDGQAWYTREVTHYVAPAERAASALP